MMTWVTIAAIFLAAILKWWIGRRKDDEATLAKVEAEGAKAASRANKFLADNAGTDIGLRDKDDPFAVRVGLPDTAWDRSAVLEFGDEREDVRNVAEVPAPEPRKATHRLLSRFRPRR